MARGTAFAVLVLAAALGGLFSAMPAGAADPHSHPFTATVQETVIPPDVCDPGVSCVITETGTITGSLTGPGTVGIVRNIVYGSATGCTIAGTSTETISIVTRSGNLSVTSAGSWCVTGSGATETGTLTITGGTGRFTGATGTGSYSVIASPISGNSTENWAGVVG